MSQSFYTLPPGRLFLDRYASSDGMVWFVIPLLLSTAGALLLSVMICIASYLITLIEGLLL